MTSTTESSKSLSDLASSLVRTIVPILVGTAIAFLARHGLNISDSQAVVVNNWLIPVCIGGYYSAARIAEKRWPAVGWLLGLPKQPGYSTAPVPPAQPAPGDVTSADPVDPSAFNAGGVIGSGLSQLLSTTEAHVSPLVTIVVNGVPAPTITGLEVDPALMAVIEKKLEAAMRRRRRKPGS